MTRATLRREAGAVELHLNDVFDYEHPGRGEPHPAQRTLLACDKRFIVLVTGRRFGKTDYLLYRLISGALERPRYPYWYIAPTYRQAEAIAWDKLKRWAKGPLKPVVTAIRDSDLEIRFTEGGVLTLKGADKPESLEGPGLGGVALDEYAGMGRKVWEETIRPMLADTRGWAVLAGKPKPVEHFKTLYDRARSGAAGDDWAAFHFTSYDNPHLDRQELEDMKRDLSTLTFRQEVLAEWVGSGGLVYPMFDPAVHVLADGVLPTAMLRVRALDPGMRHPTACSWGVVDREGTLFIEDEYLASNKTIRDNAAAIRAQQGPRGLAYTLIDPSAAHRDPVTGLSLQLEYAKAGIPTRPANNAVEFGIEAVRKRLESDPADPQPRPRLYVFRRCAQTIRQLQALRWEDLGDPAEVAVRPKIHKVEDDLADDVRYLCATPGLEGTAYRGVTPKRQPFEISLTPDEPAEDAYDPVTGRSVVRV